MPEELLINVNPFETRVALVAHGLLQELHIARSAGYSVTGNIYLGKVVRIVPGMQAAFVDLGLERPGFLHARDIDSPRIMRGDEPEHAARKPDIRDLLHDGQSVLVQVEKDPIAAKGARLSTQISLASKYLVLMPQETHVGLSQRIDDVAERGRLQEILLALIEAQPTPMGLIARTACEGASRAQLTQDLALLTRLWQRVSERLPQASAPSLVHEELPLHTRTIRDLVGPDTTAVLIDDAATFQRVNRYVSEFAPGYGERLQCYEAPRPLFERHGVEDEIARALAAKVLLKSGGSLVIEPTEALVSIDVNTGGYLGGHSHEETVYRTNLEAAAAIPRQLRLRNLGGIIVVDFIDMHSEEHQRQVLRTLEKALEADPARTRVEGFSSLGLVQISRKRTRESLLQSLCVPCEQCQGIGQVRAAETTCIEVLRALSHDHQVRSRKKNTGGDYLVRATQAVVDRFLDEEATYLAELSASIQREIRMQVEPGYREGQFDIVLVQPVAQ